MNNDASYLEQKIAQLQQHQPQGNNSQQLQQRAILNQQTQSSNPSLHQQDKISTANVPLMGNVANSFCEILLYIFFFFWILQSAYNYLFSVKWIDVLILDATIFLLCFC